MSAVLGNCTTGRIASYIDIRRIVTCCEWELCRVNLVRGFGRIALFVSFIVRRTPLKFGPELHEF